MHQSKLINSLAEQSASPWSPHPVYAGVALKTLAAGAQTGGRMSVHLVRVGPGCRLERHVHPGQCETHLVLAGSGKAWLADQPVDYVAGNVQVIDAGAAHAVQAGDAGLVLMAIFGPA